METYNDNEDKLFSMSFDDDNENDNENKLVSMSFDHNRRQDHDSNNNDYIQNILRSYFSHLPQWGHSLISDVQAYCLNTKKSDIVELACFLLYNGYNTYVETTTDKEKNFTKPTRHEFIIVTKENNEKDKEEDNEKEEDILIDLKYKEQFNIPKFNEAYGELLEIIPTVFIGSRNNMVLAAQIVWDKMIKQYEINSMSIPPWRKIDVFLSRWNEIPIARKIYAPKTINKYKKNENELLKIYKQTMKVFQS